MIPCSGIFCIVLNGYCLEITLQALYRLKIGRSTDHGHQRAPENTVVLDLSSTWWLRLSSSYQDNCNKTKGRIIKCNVYSCDVYRFEAFVTHWMFVWVPGSSINNTPTYTEMAMVKRKYHRDAEEPQMHAGISNWMYHSWIDCLFAGLPTDLVYCHQTGSTQSLHLGCRISTSLSFFLIRLQEKEEEKGSPRLSNAILPFTQKSAIKTPQL